MLTPEESNILAVEAGYRRYNERDRSQPWPDDETKGFWLEDAEYRSAREDPDSAVHRGMDAIRLQFQRWHEAYPDLRVEVLESWANEDKVAVWVPRGVLRQGGGAGAHRARPVTGERRH